MKKILFTLFIILSVSLLRAGTVEKTYHFTDAKITASGQYQFISFDNTLITGIAGEPALPYYAVQLLLLPGQIATAIEFNGEDETMVPGVFHLYPQQHSQPLSKGKSGQFIVNQIIYGSDEAYPGSQTGHLTTQYMNGYAFALSAFTPVIYHPLSGKVSYYKKVTIRIQTREDQKSIAALKLLPSSPDITDRIAHFAQNGELASEYPTRQIRSSDDYQLLIITPSLYENSFQDLIGLYLERGIKTQVMTTEAIEAGMPGQDLQEKIRNYIIQEYTDHGVEYILLGGDVELVPYRGFYCIVYSSSVYESNDIPSDLYYSGLDGTWNDNGNDKWGEIGEDDLLPDVAVARMPFGNQNELNKILNKTISYQDNPVLGELNQPLLAGEHLYDNPETWGSDYLNLLIGYHEDNGYTTDGIPVDDPYETMYDEDGTWSGSQLMQKINEGKSFVHHCGHASTEYVMKWYNSDITNVNFSQVNGVIHNFTIVYTHGCDCGGFDYNDCIGERMVLIDNFAAAFIGNSRYGWFNEGQTEGPSAHLHREFVDALYHDKLNRAGRAHMESRIQTAPWVNAPGQWEEGALRWCFYDCNVLGDPAMAIWTENPIDIQTVYPSTIPIGAATMDVTVTSNGLPAVGLRCALLNESTLYGIGITDDNGEASITIDPVFTEVGNATLIVSGYDCLPTSYSIDIIPNQGAYVVYASSTIDDSGGNGNGQADFGETISLSVSMSNVGTETAYNTDVMLATNDNYVTITDNEENYGDIAGGETLAIDHAFSFDVADNIPDQHAVTFNVEAVSNDTWYSDFTVIVNAPKLTIGKMTIDDTAGGNGNGNLDPGETADIVIESSNTGHSTCYDITGTLSTTSPYVTLLSNIYPVNELTPGGSFNASFQITVDEYTPIGTSIDLSYMLTSHEYSDQKTFMRTVGIIYEDFETADFSKFDWQFTGDQPWSISETMPYEGTYSAQSGNIDDQQSSEMSLTLDVLADDSISFYRKVSSELDYDYLQFFIDNTTAGEWSGESNWQRVVFPVTTGQHTFRWVYSKDISMTGGQDKVWVDYIVFPPVLLPVGIEETMKLGKLSVFPNPFSDVMTIDYALEKTAPVKMTLINLTGQDVKVITNLPDQSAGYHRTILNGDGLNPGIYLLRFETGKLTVIKKIIFTK
jgi:hypothetical protein